MAPADGNTLCVFAIISDHLNNEVPKEPEPSVAGTTVAPPTPLASITSVEAFTECLLILRSASAEPDPHKTEPSPVIPNLEDVSSVDAPFVLCVSKMFCVDELVKTLMPEYVPSFIIDNFIICLKNVI